MGDCCWPYPAPTLLPLAQSSFKKELQEGLSLGCRQHLCSALACALLGATSCAHVALRSSRGEDSGQRSGRCRSSPSRAHKARPAAASSSLRQEEQLGCGGC